MYNLKRLSEQCLEVRMDYAPGFKQSFLLQSDIHFDNPKCLRKLYFRHLEEAKAKKAGIITVGDMFCLMQGKGDPRGSKSDIRPEHNTNNYIDAVINTTAEEIAPYRDNFVVFSDGNHETNIIKRRETNPLKRLCEQLNHKYNPKNNQHVEHMNYQGFIKFVFQHKSGGQIKNKILFFHHGKWSGSSNKGITSALHYSEMVPDADYVLSGHIHQLLNDPRRVLRLKNNGQVEFKRRYFLKTATYKDEFQKGSGWATEKIVKPGNIGGIWLNFFWENNQMQEEIIYTSY